LWIGILHHVVNEHEWALRDGVGDGKCGHDALSEEERTKPWLTKDSSPHKALRKIVLQKRLLNGLPYYTNFRYSKRHIAIQVYTIMVLCAMLG
jgi:hypothetical protein